MHRGVGVTRQSEREGEMLLLPPSMPENVCVCVSGGWKLTADVALSQVKYSEELNANTEA